MQYIQCVFERVLNPLMTNRFTHHYHLGETTIIFRGVRSDFYFLPLLMKFLLANRIAPDGTPHSVASNLGLFCLPISHKWDTRLKELNLELQRVVAQLLHL